MKALIEAEAPGAQKAQCGIGLRILLYGAVALGVLVLAIVSMVGRLSVLSDVHRWIFGS